MNGLYCGLAPGPAAEAYGLPGPVDFKIVEIIKSMGYTFVSVAVLALSVLKGVPLNQAIMWSVVPWTLLSLDNLWNGTAKKMGQPEGAPLLLLAINIATISNLYYILSSFSQWDSWI